jgi:hypothetical protein
VSIRSRKFLKINQTSRLIRILVSIAITSSIFTAVNVQSAFPSAQIVSNEGFLKGLYAEVGIRANGAFGSTSVPAGFNSNVGSCLGFRVDRAKDGWATGPNDGDFFCPGQPYEEWALSVGGSSFNANNNNSVTIPGANSNNVTSGTTHSVTWTSTSNLSGVSVRIINSIENAGQTLNTDVTLTNTTASPIADVFFGRGVDPDNGNLGSPFTSTNTVVGQGSDAFVKAEWPDGSLLGLRSTDPRARVVRQSNSFGSANPKTVWDAGEARTASGTYLGNLGATVADAGMYLAIKEPSLAANSSTTFRISYVLSLVESTIPTVNATAASNFASNIKSATATLNGAVNARGISTATSFEYSTNANLSDTQTVSSTTLSSSQETAISANISGLLPFTRYYFRAKAVNASGTTLGSIFSFITFPRISLQPTNDTTTAGLTDSFTIGTTLVASPFSKTVKWQVATDTVTADASVSWSDVASGTGFTTDTFTTAALTTSMNKYRYRAIVTFADTSTTFVETSTIATLTVNPAITFTSSTSTITQKYGAGGTTRTVTFTGGTDTRTVSASSLSLASGRITFETSTARFTIDTRTAVGTYLDTITITDAKGATASYVQIITYTAADTLTVTSDTPTALTFTGSSAVFTPTVSSVSGLVSGDVISGATFNFTNSGGSSYGPSTTKPTNAGTYVITPSALTFSSGALSNYAAVTYRTSTLTINKAAQAALSVVPLYLPFNSNPTTATLLTTGGSDTGTVTYAYVPLSSTAGGCALSGADSSTVSVTSDGTCRIVATKAATNNFLVAISDTGTVTFHLYVTKIPAPRAAEFPAEIVLSGATTLTNNGLAPTITFTGTDISAAPGALFTISGSGFVGTRLVRVSGISAVFTVLSDTSLRITMPAGLTGMSGPIYVEKAEGSRASEDWVVGT